MDWILMSTAFSGDLGTDAIVRRSWLKILLDPPLSKYFGQPVFRRLKYHARRARARADLEILRLIRTHIGAPEEVNLFSIVLSFFLSFLTFF